MHLPDASQIDAREGGKHELMTALLMNELGLDGE